MKTNKLPSAFLILSFCISCGSSMEEDKALSHAEDLGKKKCECAREGADLEQCEIDIAELERFLDYDFDDAEAAGLDLDELEDKVEAKISEAEKSCD